MQGTGNVLRNNVTKPLEKSWVNLRLQTFLAGDSVLSVLATKKAGIKPAILFLWDVLESPKGMPVAEPTTYCLSSAGLRRELSRMLADTVRSRSGVTCQRPQDLTALKKERKEICCCFRF